MRSTLNKGRSAFLEYYTQLLPQFDTPEKLDKYLTAKNPPVLLVSPAFSQELQSLWDKAGLSWLPLDWFPSALAWPPEVPVGTSLPGYQEGWLYALNPASLLPVVALAPQTGESILDACAAPGGKTLAIASVVHTGKTMIVANDASLPRFKRMRTAYKLFGFPDLVTTNFSVQALQHTANTSFDKILLDAPCSSEKHVYNSKKHLKIWSPNRSKTLSHLQGLLIDSLLPLLNPGGTLVYSTCALTPLENEDVVNAALKKHSNLSLASSGMQRFNDPDSPFDPMFVATLTRQD